MTYDMPDLLKATLFNNSILSEWFHQLSIVKHKGYANYISDTKPKKAYQVKNITPLIVVGVGLKDKYR